MSINLTEKKTMRNHTSGFNIDELLTWYAKFFIPRSPQKKNKNPIMIQES